MELFSRKPKTNIEDFCRQFYDSQIFSEQASREGESSTFWQDALNFILETDPSLVKVDHDLFRREVTALRMELFGMVWQEHVWPRAGEQKSNPEVLKHIPREIVFTKSYLQQNEHPDIWDSMSAYNEATANHKKHCDAERRIYRKSADYFIEEGIKSGIIKEKVDADCAGRIANRISDRLSYDLIDHLTGTAANRLGWDMKPDSEPFLQLNGVILYWYGHAMACVEWVAIDTRKGTVKTKFWDLIREMGVGVVWILGVCLFWYAMDATDDGPDWSFYKIAASLLLVLICVPGIQLLWKGIRDLRRLWKSQVFALLECGDTSK